MRDHRPSMVLLLCLSICWGCAHKGKTTIYNLAATRINAHGQLDMLIKKHVVWSETPLLSADPTTARRMVKEEMEWYAFQSLELSLSGEIAFAEQGCVWVADGFSDDRIFRYTSDSDTLFYHGGLARIGGATEESIGMPAGGRPLELMGRHGEKVFSQIGSNIYQLDVSAGEASCVGVTPGADQTSAWMADSLEIFSVCLDSCLLRWNRYSNSVDQYSLVTGVMAAQVSGPPGSQLISAEESDGAVFYAFGPPYQATPTVTIMRGDTVEAQRTHESFGRLDYGDDYLLLPSQSLAVSIDDSILNRERRLRVYIWNWETDQFVTNIVELPRLP